MHSANPVISLGTWLLSESNHTSKSLTLTEIFALILQFHWTESPDLYMPDPNIWNKHDKKFGNQNEEPWPVTKFSLGAKGETRVQWHCRLARDNRAMKGYRKYQFNGLLNRFSDNLLFLKNPPSLYVGVPHWTKIRPQHIGHFRNFRNFRHAATQPPKSKWHTEEEEEKRLPLTSVAHTPARKNKLTYLPALCSTYRAILAVFWYGGGSASMISSCGLDSGLIKRSGNTCRDYVDS